MSLATGDMQAFCYYEFELCDAPPVVRINEDEWFTPKPANKTAAPPASGNSLEVLHVRITMGDTHDTVCDTR